jgi:hypothetical protein
MQVLCGAWHNGASRSAGNPSRKGHWLEQEALLALQTPQAVTLHGSALSSVCNPNKSMHVMAGGVVQVSRPGCRSARQGLGGPISWFVSPTLPLPHGSVFD